MKVEMLFDYISDNLVKQFLHSSNFLSNAFVFLVKKKVDSWWLFLDHHGWNLIYRRNYNVICPILEVFDCVMDVTVYTKWDIQTVDNSIELRLNNEWKIVFGRRYSYFKHHVMSFRVVNGLAIFQRYIGIFCIIHIWTMFSSNL